MRCQEIFKTADSIGFPLPKGSDFNHSFKKAIQGLLFKFNPLKRLFSVLTILLLLSSLLTGCGVCYAEKASWYGNESIVWKWGGHTRNGEMFDENKLTCALPNKNQLNRYYKVTNVKNGKSVIVWANDTGSFAKYGRAIDLSKSAFKKLSPLNKGIIEVKIEVCND